ncbi:MAG: endolytic transglycosylase MltG [Ignavibacteria bacterium]
MNSFFEIIKRSYKYLIVLNIILLAFIIYQLFFSKYHWNGNDEKRFIIEPGKSSDQIISELEKNDIIPSSLIFKIVLKLTGKEAQIISNHYLFKNGMNNLQLLEQLTNKELNQKVKLVIPEGYTIKQIGKLIEKKLSLSKEKFYNESTNDSLINLLGINGKVKTLEGFLYPDTYDVSPSISEKAIVLILFNEFRKKISRSDLPELKDSMLLATITLASIIQGETRLEKEMPVVAGVYVNRMKKGMRLEADPTIQYIIADGPRRLLYEDLKINSPYNTYINKGLPPGPINNPGISAIRAALEPDEHNFIFFVATGQGGHKFTENYEQHLNAVKEYRRIMKNDSSQKK